MANENRNSVDYEEVLRVLPELFQNIWKDNPDVLVYLSDLGALGLQRLSQEPDRLAEEKATILEQTQDLAFHNYKTFIQAADCSHEIFQDFNVIESRLESLLNKLPKFSEKCSEFGKEAQQINARWHQASSTLAKHPQLLEFLEMPQLMENCVRSEFYDEALELSSYVKRLQRKHHDIPLIKNIVVDVQAAVHVMLSQLLEKLRTNIQLPECLKVVGYLRRMDVFSEAELRIKFLQARDSWFQKVIVDIDNDAYQHIIKVIESSRIHLFDIITQYRAIFSDDDPLLLVRENSVNDSAIFQSWISWKISQFLHILEKDLASDLGGRVDSVLAQCMYFGLSFSRVNVDFRPLLVPIFQKAAFLKFKISLEKATSKFELSMQNYVIATYTNTMFLVPSHFSEEILQPPSSLLDFYPLAQYCNDLLCAFNELKLSSSFAISSDITSLVEESLKRLVGKMLDIYSFRRFTMTDKENELFIKLCFQFSSDLVPHLNKCLTVLFPSEEMASVLGVTSLEFKKLEYLCKLNTKSILEPLEEILPSKDENDVGLIMAIGRPSETEKSTFTTISKEISFSEDKIKLNKSDDIHKPLDPDILPASEGDRQFIDILSSEEQHLGNVELTITTKDHVEHTLEMLNHEEEQDLTAQFNVNKETEVGQVTPLKQCLAKVDDDINVLVSKSQVEENISKNSVYTTESSVQHNLDISTIVKTENDAKLLPDFDDIQQTIVSNSDT